jgi:hypothetical protein
MIFERRAYLLKPGYADDFWLAQQEWNRPDIFGAILGHNLFYASSASSEGTLIVHLYRFADLLEWQQAYADYYQRQSPDYFAKVRPWMMEQENSFFRPAGVPQPEAFLRRPDRGDQGAEDIPPSEMRLVETVIDLVPGGLSAFTERGERECPARIGIDSNTHIGSLISLIGRQHRVVHYHVCHGREEADRRVNTITDALRGYDERCGRLGFSHRLLTPSPNASRRQFLEGPH